MDRVVDVPVPEMVEQLVKLPKTVSEDGIQERLVEQTIDTLVPQDVKEPAEFFKASSQDRAQQSSPEQTNEPLPFFSLGRSLRYLSFRRKDGTGCEHARSTRRRHSRIGETHHPGEHQPGDQAHRSSTAAVSWRRDKPT